ncbi:hypothetical protein JQ633_16330 [Bradyrhizobium tropiciagri]|uniref:hypothetical protein n=1 Tax=Bradyrhizobium tropiciagri TaxID=312253 RepID=UPI001BADD4D3|nr:hypothetical protein [Bradyrhizobium tropiciagri]MBR0871934.1 hypothetical protein [Bradyrhizobium tropiciagri]
MTAVNPHRAEAADETAAAGLAVLYEEDTSNPTGRRLTGSVVWHTDTIKSAGAAAETFVVGDVDVPGRLKLTLTLKRNTDRTLPASHVFELTFVPVPGFVGHHVNSVPGMLTKVDQQTRGTPLAGLAVKVTDNVFMVGLSNVDADRERNLTLLRERPWIDIPIVDGIQHRAILAIEKGETGQSAFAAAMTAWGQN